MSPSDAKANRTLSIHLITAMMQSYLWVRLHFILIKPFIWGVGMDSTRIMIAMSSDALVLKLKTILVEAGFMIIEQSNEGQDCLRKMRALKPDIIILEYNLPHMNGLEISRVALEDGICDAMLFVSADQDSMVDDIRQESGFVSLVKPVNRMLLIGSLELMIKDRRKIKQLEKEIEGLKLSLDTRKEVEKAKGLLMANLGLTESAAFKRIQKQSMDRGIPMKEIAKAIILAYDI
jgi:two-component system, response regulator PdtaR